MLFGLILTVVSFTWLAFTTNLVAAFLALLAIAFGSYVQPLIVMMSIPFGIIGAVLGHILLGYNLSLVSLMGVVAVSGVVINGALIMVHHANRNRATMSAYDAIHEAGLRRFRPILLTSVTTIVGLTPMMLERSIQAAFLIPIVVSLAFGVFFAFFVTLLMVPSLYGIGLDIGAFFGRIKAWIKSKLPGRSHHDAEATNP